MKATTEIDQYSDWYIVHTYSGQEDRVKKNLDIRVQSLDMQDRIYQVVVPTEEEIVIRDGKRRKERRKVFPGYILIQMKMDEESWYAVRNTPGVTGFISNEDELDKRLKPTPMEPEEGRLHHVPAGNRTPPRQRGTPGRTNRPHHRRPLRRLHGHRRRGGPGPLPHSRPSSPSSDAKPPWNSTSSRWKSSEKRSPVLDTH